MNLTQKTPDTLPNGESASQVGVASTTRRRILRGGLSAAPILMVSAPRSVMAGAGNCVPASSFASINASRPDLFSTCSGRTPGYWKQPQWFWRWPAGFLPVAAGAKPATTFDGVFGPVGGYPGKTLLQILELPGNTGGRDALARHIVAALLNAAAGLTPTNVLGVSQVKVVWAEFVARGYYEPTAGIKWYPDYAMPAGTGGITPWLRSTMPV